MLQRFDPEDKEQAPKSGLLMLQALLLGMFCILVLRLWFLQVHKGDEFFRLARQNQLKEEPLYAPRGLLRDRNGQLLAVNRPSYDLTLLREQCRDLKATLDQVHRWTGLDNAVLRKKYEQGKQRVKPFDPLILASDLSFQALARIEANALFWPGLQIVTRPKRYYPQSQLLAQLLGYVAEASEDDLLRNPGLALGDSVGKQGLEAVLEETLRGDKGEQQFEVDATGRRLRGKVVRDPTAGRNISLSIDLNLQQQAANAMEGKAGAVVVLDADTGQVLAFVSEPSYDNNAFASGLSLGKWEVLRLNPRHPMQNRIHQSVYPPGSVWKLLMAAAGLHYGMIDPKERTVCTGEYHLGRRVFRCWRKEGHGAVDLEQALVQSCDVYFYRLGEKLGVDRISKYAFACGFGQPTGIGLPHEKGGLVPTREWKRQRFGEPWHGGENLNLAIGQGYTLVSPLQVARFVAALVNGGRILRPSLVLGSKPKEQGLLPLADEQRERIVQAMVATVEGDRGTAKRLRRPDATIGGKTGTAQVVKLVGEDRLDVFEMPYEHRDHAWMATFGRKDGRTYVVVAMLEHGGHGATAAGPVVQQIYKFLFG